MWAQKQDHPDMTAMEDIEVDIDLQEAVNYECNTDAEVIDDIRQRALNELLWVKVQSAPARERWVKAAPEQMQDFVDKLDGMVAHFIEEACESEDKGSASHLQAGIPVAGEMPDQFIATVERHE